MKDTNNAYRYLEYAKMHWSPRQRSIGRYQSLAWVRCGFAAAFGNLIGETIVSGVYCKDIFSIVDLYDEALNFGLEWVPSNEGFLEELETIKAAYREKGPKPTLDPDIAITELEQLFIAMQLERSDTDEQQR